MLAIWLRDRVGQRRGVEAEMADGAWQGGYFDSGNQGAVHYHVPQQHIVAPPPPPLAGDNLVQYHLATPGGAPLAVYNLPPAGKELVLATSAITLRILTIVFTLVAFLTTIMNNGYETVESPCRRTSKCYPGTYPYKRRWSAFQFRDAGLFVIGNGIVCFYSVVQLAISLVRPCTGRPVLLAPTGISSTVTFFFDQIMTYLMMGVCGAGVYVARTDYRWSKAHIYGWDEYRTSYCNAFKTYCSIWTATIVTSCIALVFIAITAHLQYVYRVYTMATR